MKRLAYITAVILSLLIIYSGAGVSIVHYCCSRCETVQGCCADGCPKCKKSHTCDSKKDCREKGCTATIYKPDLMKHISELTVSVPVITLFCEQYCQLCFHFYRPDGGLFQSSFSAISLSEAEAGVTFRFSDLAVISSFLSDCTLFSAFAGYENKENECNSVAREMN